MSDSKHLLVAPELGEIVKDLVGHLGDVQLVVSWHHDCQRAKSSESSQANLLTDGQQVVVELLEDFVRVLAIRCGGIAEAGTIVQVTLGIYVNMDSSGAWQMVDGRWPYQYRL